MPFTFLSIVVSGLKVIANAAVNAWSGRDNRIPSTKITQENREHSKKMQLAQMKLSILQQEKAQDFQRGLAELNHQRAIEIESFRQSVNIAINQKNLDFQKWSLEQEKQIQYEILQLQQEFQRELTNTQHQNALEQIRERIRADNSPILSLAADLLENSFTHEVMPLKVLLSPPVLDYDSSIANSYVTGFESFLSEEIRQFLHQGYLNSKQYPVQLLDKAWSTKRQGGGAAIHSLYAQLKSIPVLVLESEIVGDELNFRLGYWSGGNVSLTESTILSRHPFTNLLYESAKQKALIWQEKRQKLLASGKFDEAYISNLGGVDEKNLQILEQELAEKAVLEEHGIDISHLPMSKAYQITDQDYKNFYEFLSVYHCLTIGLFADILFLMRSWSNTPLLPTILPYLLNKYKNHPLLPPEFWQQAILDAVKVYGEIYNSFAADCSSVMPEIRMRFAASLADLPGEYRYLALEQANIATAAWLKSNNLPSDKIFDVNNDEDCQLLKRIIYQEDKPLFEALQRLLDKIKDAEAIEDSQTEKISRLLQSWQFLNRWGTIAQLPQLENTQQKKEIIQETEKVTQQKKEIIQESSFSNFTEILLNDIKLEMIAIPAGEFMMGSNQYNSANSEKPIHQVKLQGFYIGKYAITQWQYQAIMGHNPSHFKGDYRPVEKVTWHNAVEFCRKLSEKTGKTYQLPSEAQWEYACRAGTTTKWCFGDNPSQLGEYAWYEVNSSQQTHPVGEKKPNQWGIYDMHGNVWEWCADTWHPNYQGAPTDGSVWGGTINNDNYSRFLLRGGSWNNSAYGCHSLYRNSFTRYYSNEVIGFRVVCLLEKTL